MALFNYLPATRVQVRPVHQHHPLPGHINCTCDGHGTHPPIPMQYCGVMYSDRTGRPFKGFRCKYCGRLVAWIIDVHTGRPRVLFSKG